MPLEPKLSDALQRSHPTLPVLVTHASLLAAKPALSTG